jgi:hypothetical protein
VRYLGADVVLVDIDPATLCIDPARSRRRSRRARRRHAGALRRARGRHAALLRDRRKRTG